MITTDAVQLFSALLAGVALVLAAIAVVPAGRRVLAPVALWLAFGVAAYATAGSLYFSEVANYKPCVLCWYQRIGMYPLAVVLLMGALRRDVNARYYAVPLAAVALPISIYHYAIERVPSLESGACDPTNPCSLIWFEEFGFVTLPLMAAVGFVTVIVLTLIARPQGEPS